MRANALENNYGDRTPHQAAPPSRRPDEVGDAVDPPTARVVSVPP